MTIDSPPAIIQGQPLTELPVGLYVPPEALRIFLESFEGPLDLLLYLIQNQHIDILNIPIAEITQQYVHYIELMTELQLDLAAEYLLMAALLSEIKSRLLLPTLAAADSSEPDDPRTKLVEQLQEYARYKHAAQQLADLPQIGRDIFPVAVIKPEIATEIIIPSISWSELLATMQAVMKRATFFSSHQILREPLSVRERMSLILAALNQSPGIEFIQLFTVEEGRAGVVVTLLALLELAKESLIQLVQLQPFATIQVLKIESI
ncbi:MAG: segregation/condensation protein A [Thioploca sp.]|nr:segregation/condensation protein A [Thioploca sp.]